MPKDKLKRRKKRIKKFWVKGKILKDKRGNTIAMRISKTFNPANL